MRLWYFFIATGIFLVAGALAFATLSMTDTPRDQRRPWLITLLAFLTVTVFGASVYVLSL